MSLHRQSVKQGQAMARGWDPLRRLAEQATGFRPACRHPEAVLDLAGRIADHDRNYVYGPVTERQRRLLAAGIPHQEFADRFSEGAIASAAQLAVGHGVFTGLQNDCSGAV